MRGKRGKKGSTVFDVPTESEPFAAKVARLRAAVEAATTWDEFEGARAAVRHAFGFRDLDVTDLSAVCERKRLTFPVQEP